VSPRLEEGGDEFLFGHAEMLVERRGGDIERLGEVLGSTLAGPLVVAGGLRRNECRPLFLGQTVLDRFAETIPKRGAIILVCAGMAPWAQISSQRADLPEKSIPVGESRAWEEGLSLDDVSLRVATGFGEYPKHADRA